MTDHIGQPNGEYLNDGTLSVAINRRGVDSYDFGSRAILVRQLKEELGLPETEPLPSPWTVEIEPTLNCNAHCHFCSYEEDIAKFKMLMREKQGKEYGLSRDTVMDTLTALKEAGTTAGTFWSGGGDPLVWPHIVEAVRYASTFSEVSMQTNGIGLGKFMRDPQDLGLIRLLSISVYGDDPDLHAKIAGVRSFEKVVGNITKAIELKRQNDLNVDVNVKVIVDANNYARLPEIVQFYEALGVDSIGLREVQDYNYGGDGQRTESVELTQAQRQELCDIIKQSGYRHPSLDNFGFTVMRKIAKPAITSHCFNAIDGHFACIDAWGEVFIGNPEIGDSKFSIGNINQQPWGEIWKGPRHLEVIEQMDSLQVKGLCASALCRHVRANVGTQRYLDGETQPQDRQAVMQELGAFL